MTPRSRPAPPRNPAGRRAARPALLATAALLSARAAPAAVTSDLPLVVLDTHGRTIRNDVRIPADLAVADRRDGGRNASTGPFDGWAGPVTIEIRGSSAVWQGWPKQSYALETKDATGAAADASLLGMPAENDWVLYGPYTDKTYLRDALAYRLAREMGRYAPRTRFCDLVLNGEARGVYLLVEKIKRDRNRVNVADLDPEDASGDALTGGYVFKVDRPAGVENEGWTSRWSPGPWASAKLRYLYHYPKPEDLTDVQRAYLREWMDRFEALMAGPDPQAAADSLVDLGAFADIVLLNELTRNVDAWSLSTFFHKDRDSRGGRLACGPAWDYNLGFGNADYYAGDSTSGWMIERKVRLRDRIPAWAGVLWGLPRVQERLRVRYRELRQGVLSPEVLASWVDAWADTLTEAEARDHALYPVLGVYVWPNPFVGATYGEETGHLKDWILRRLEWMDGRWGSASAGRAPEPGARFALGLNYPNPFNGATVLPFALDRPGRVRVRVLDRSGRRVWERDLGVLQTGPHRIAWEAGDAASGVYLVQVEAGGRMSVRRVVLAR